MTDGENMQLRDWVGRTEQRDDAVTATPYAALSATLDRDPTFPLNGTALPALWHWLYFLPLHRRSVLGADGHAKHGGLLPPSPLPRRMWAGSQVQFHHPIMIGDELRRLSTIERIEHKSGHTGELVFVNVRHQFYANGSTTCALTEIQNVVYRRAASSTDTLSQPRPAPPVCAWKRTWTPDEVLLFRYSALTFNNHRIHYDRRYATEVEGYPGLVVHGPLIATLLLDLLRSKRPDAFVTRFDFRAVRPLFDLHSFDVCGEPVADGNLIRLWAKDQEGWLAMEATAEIQ